MADFLEFIPLGGLGEFGMNCATFRYGQDMILIDAGITFPSVDQGGDLGVDVIVPDISFLKEYSHQLRAVLLTHGHEDHAGGVSYVVDEIPVPVYGSRLTLGMVASRLKERGLRERTELIPIEARQILQFGAFSVEPLHVTHSFPDAFCFAISTPVGQIIWTGDFKFDQTPIDKKTTDIARLSEYGERGLLALFSDSTNSEVPGLAPSEFGMYRALGSLVREAPGKIIVSCFASSIHRIQVVMKLAQEAGRKVAPVGRSMVSNIRIASELGYLEVPKGLLISIKEAKQYSPSELLIVASGTQGEPMAALSRIAVDEFKGLTLEEGDTIILSARVIPGNEKRISNLTNHFYRRGARVYDSRQASIHASGHGLRDDLKLMINLTRPRFFIPIHGEYRQLKNHSLLALDQGVSAENVLILETGQSLRFSPDSAEKGEQIPVGRRFMDETVSEVHEVVLRDRRYLSEDGFVVLFVRINRSSGELVGSPELVSRGFVWIDESTELMEAAQQDVASIVSKTPLEEKQDEELFKEVLRAGLRRFLRKNTGKRPMILPVIVVS